MGLSPSFFTEICVGGLEVEAWVAMVWVLGGGA